MPGDYPAIQAGIDASVLDGFTLIHGYAEYACPVIMIDGRIRPQEAGFDMGSDEVPERGLVIGFARD